MIYKSLIVTALAIAASNAYAQAPAQAPGPTEYTLKLTPADLDLVGKAVGLLSYNEAAPLMVKLRQQVMEQQTPKPVEPKKE